MEEIGDYVSEEVYPIHLGLELYLTKGKAISANSTAFNKLKLSLRDFEEYFNERRWEHFDIVGTYRPYHFNNENFGLYIYAEMFGMYLLSIIKHYGLTLRESHTLALDSILTHGSFHYLIERYCTLVDNSTDEEERLYSIYKKKIYSKTWGTRECLEETLANDFVLRANPLWDERYIKSTRSLYARQRGGYREALELNPESYRKLLLTLERQIKDQREGRNYPTLYDFININIPFRFIGLPVYLVNDCKKKEEFIQIVELLFPNI